MFFPPFFFLCSSVGVEKRPFVNWSFSGFDFSPCRGSCAQMRREDGLGSTTAGVPSVHPSICFHFGSRTKSFVVRVRSSVGDCARSAVKRFTPGSSGRHRGRSKLTLARWWWVDTCVVFSSNNAPRWFYKFSSLIHRALLFFLVLSCRPPVPASECLASSSRQRRAGFWMYSPAGSRAADAGWTLSVYSRFNRIIRPLPL